MWSLIGVLVGLVVVLSVILFWFDRQFEEPNADHIPSLVTHLEARSVLGVFAHPDDEILAAGLLTDAAGREGFVVRIITVTKGEAGIADPPISRTEDLALIRHAELLKHAFALGVDQVEIWSYPDGNLESVPLEDVVRRIVARIREWKPDLVVTFDPESGYTYNPDHMMIGRATVQAFRAAGDSDFEPTLGEPFNARWLAYILVPRPIMRIFAGERGRKVASKQMAPVFSVPADISLKVRGWRIHESQSGNPPRVMGMPPWLLYQFFDKEHFFVIKGDEVRRQVR